jgi:hypothetical protein
MIKKWKDFNENSQENEDVLSLDESLFGFADSIKEIEEKYGIVSLSESIYKLLTERTALCLNLNEDFWFDYQDIIISVDPTLFHFSISYYEDDMNIPGEEANIDLAYAEEWGDYISTALKLIENFMIYPRIR